MPNQQDYQENISNFIRGSSIDRVVIPYIYDSVILPNAFGNDPSNDFIELNFYDYSSNALIDTIIISGKLNAKHNYIYRRVNDASAVGTDELVVRMRALIDDGVLTVSPGYYNVSVNFFSHEVGSVYQRPLSIIQVSASRKELIVQYSQALNDTQRIAARNEIREFVEPSMEIGDMVALVKQIFKDVSTSSLAPGEYIDSSVELETYKTEYQDQYKALFENPMYVNEAIIIEEETDSFLRNGNLNDKLPTVYYYIYDELLAAFNRNDRRVQMDEMSTYISNAITRAFAVARSKFPSTIEVN